MTQPQAGLLVLRLGLAAVFLWFGFSQLFNGIAWVGFVPDWAVAFLRLPPAMIVLGNGLFEVVLGALLGMGIWVRPVALMLSLHMIVIVFEIGLTPIGVRDFGLTLATIAVALLGHERHKDHLA